MLDAVEVLEAERQAELAEPMLKSRTLSAAAAPHAAPRHCRDVAWLLVFALYWAGMAVIANWAVRNGDANRLLEGMDDANHLCGSPVTAGRDDLSTRPYVYHACLQYGHRFPTVCMPACPSLSGHYVRWYNGSAIYCDAHGRKIPATTYPTTNLRNSCVPSTAALYVLVASVIDSNAFSSVVTGMLLAWQVLVAAAVASSVLALLWMLSVRMLASYSLLAPVTVALAIGSLGFLATSLWLRAGYFASAAFADDMPVLQGSMQASTNTDMSLLLAALVTTFAIAVAVALWCGLLHRLLLAGGIIREAAVAVRAMPSLVFLLPPLLMLAICALFAYWLAISVLIASAGAPTHGEVHGDRALQLLAFAYHTVGLLWTVEAVLHLSFCASAGAVARWYFAPAELAASRPPGAAVCVALAQALRYTPGSLCLGALLVIPGRVFRFFLEHCIHQAQTDGSGKPELRGIASCCLRCCCDWPTRWLRYVSHNAYIYVAVHDMSFCEGARQAFELTLRNIGRVALLTAGERLLLTLAKLAVCCTCTAGAALAMGLQSGRWSALDNANGAMVLTFVASFCVADAWMSTFDGAVETIFLCFLVDQEENDGIDRPYYASHALQRYMEMHRPTYQLPGGSPEDGGEHSPETENTEL